LRCIENQAPADLVRRREAGPDVLQTRSASTLGDGIPTLEPGGSLGMPRGSLSDGVTADHIEYCNH
jgi:hypothetical protein